MKIRIINRFNHEIMFELEKDSLKSAVEFLVKIKANLMDANLRGADLRGANLRNANFRDADLRDANLRNANFRDADLRDADLWDADLRDADLRNANLWNADFRNKIYQIGPIGSRKDQTVYNASLDKIVCGCWKGNLGEFKDRVRSVYGKGSQYRKEYEAAIAFFETMMEGNNESDKTETAADCA